MDSIGSMTLGFAGRIYVELVDCLMNPAHGRIICMPTSDGRHLNFRVGDFRKVLISLVPDPRMYRNFMGLFRNLQWIICEEGRLTNSQRIKGKTTRVVTVDAVKYRTIKKLIEPEREVDI